MSGYLDEVLHWHAFSLSVKVQLIPIRHQVEKSVVERVRRETGDFDVGPVHDNFSGAMKETKDMGMLVVDRGRKFSRRLRHAYQECPRPMLIPGGKFPYTGVLISLNGPDPALALESGAEVARQMDAPFQVLYVALPRELRGRDEARALELRQGLVSDFESIFKHKIDFELVEGNPVTATLKRLKRETDSLLVMVGDRRRPLGVLKPNVPFMITSRTTLSTLLLPVEEPDGE